MSDYYKLNNLKNKHFADTAIARLPEFTRSFFQHLRSDQLAEGTILGYAYDIYDFFDFLVKKNPIVQSIQDVTPEILNSLEMEDFDEFKIYCAKEKEDTDGTPITNVPKTIRRKITALRAFYKFFGSKKILTSNVVFCVTLPKLPKKEIVYLQENEITNMLQEAANGKSLTEHAKAYHQKTMLRDYAIVLTLVTTGLRVSELVGMDIDRIDFNQNSAYVHRKENVEQYIYFTDQTKSAILDYVNFERKPKESKDTALFLSMRGTRISVKSVERIVQKYTKSPEVTLKHITPHKLRSTFGTNYYQETGDIYLVADALNHASVDTTAKHYAAQSSENRKRMKDIKFVKNLPSE